MGIKNSYCIGLERFHGKDINILYTYAGKGSFNVTKPTLSVYSVRISGSAHSLFNRPTYIRSPFCLLLMTWGGTELSILFLLILATATVSGALSPELQRMNYGVLYLQLSRENWIYTFEVELPENINMHKLSGCH